MTKVFISYSRKDKAFAGKFTEALEKSELETWIDWEDIPPVADWMEQIHKGIEEADAFLFLLSPDSVASKVCGQEVDYAVQNGKRLIPIVARDVNPNDVHPALGKVNWIYGREGDDFDGAINKTLSAIRTDLAWVESQRRLQVRAIEWERKNKENSFLLRGKDLQDAEQQLSLHATTDPQPTDLQREYVLKSRQVADRQRRIITGISIAGVIVMAALAVFGFIQAGLATANANEAQRNASTAQAASTLAVSNEQKAIANEQKAIVNEQEAVRQAQIAFARQLSAQAQAVYAKGYTSQPTAVLLAIQSMKIFPTSESTQFLQNHTLALPVTRMAHDTPVNAVAFSPDGGYVASGGQDGIVQVWDVASGKEVARFAHDGSVTFVAFSPDGLTVITGSDDKTARVWEIHSGKELARMTHTGSITIVVVSPDGKYIISSDGCEQAEEGDFFCSLGSARVWEAANGQEIMRITLDTFISSVAFSPNGKYIVSGSADGIVRVWETATGRETTRMAHGIGVSSVAFSPNGDFIATGGCDRAPAGSCTQGSIRVWYAWTEDWAGADELAYFTQLYNVEFVAFGADRWQIISKSSEDGTARMWNTDSGQATFQITPEDGMSSIAYSTDRKLLVSKGIASGRVWDAVSGEEIAIMLYDYDAITSVALSPDGRYVVSGGTDGSVQVWQAKRSQFLARLDNGVESLALSPDSRLVMAGAPFNTKLWDITGGQEIASIHFDNQMDTIIFSPDFKYTVSRNWSGTAWVWETATGKEVTRITQPDRIPVITFSPDGKYIASTKCDAEQNSTGCLRESVSIRELSTEQEVVLLPHKGLVTSIDFSPDGKYVVSVGCAEQNDAGCLKDAVTIWDTATGQATVHLPHAGLIKSIDLSPDWKYLVLVGCGEKNDAGCLKDAVSIWDTTTAQELARLPNKGLVKSIKFSPDGKYFVSFGCEERNDTGCLKNAVKVWNTATGQEITRLPLESMDAIALSPDGKYIVSRGDGIARVWDVISGQEIAHVTHDDNIKSIAFNQDGRYVVSGDTGGTIRVWEAATGKEIARATQSGRIVYVFFSADGKYVASGSEDGIVRVWMWQPEDLVSEACKRVPRNLTRPEWQQYIGGVLPYQAICTGLPVEPESTPTPEATP